MAQSRRALEVDEDFRFQQRTWTAERVAWALMALLLMAAMAGAFGGGPLNWNTVSGERGVEIEYSQLRRVSAPAPMVIRVDGVHVSDTAYPVVLDAAFLDAYRIERIRPEPAEWIARRGGVLLRFNIVDAPAVLRFDLRTESIGYHTPTVQAGTGQPIPVPVLIYP